MTHLLKRQVRVCGYLDCPRLVVHPGYLYYNEQLSDEESWNANIRVFSGLIPLLKKYHVTLCIENLFLSRQRKIMDGVCSDAEEACRYVDTLNEMAGEKCFAFCLDTGHSLMLGKDMRKFIHTLGHRIEEPRGSLVPIVTREAWPAGLAGLTLKNVTLSAERNAPPGLFFWAA